MAIEKILMLDVAVLVLIGGFRDINKVTMIGLGEDIPCVCSTLSPRPLIS